ncbi:MAG: DUF4920 domain-containing protein [Longimicrobiales bacterium]|nr:DUF4920 domain-containing protein [Longimicrobiales bacterium]
MSRRRNRTPSAASTAAVLLIAAACTGPGADAPGGGDAAVDRAAAFTGTPYGEPLTLSDVTPVSAILEAPEAYLGERVLVEGMVVAVCESRGCWMDIAGDRDFEKIQVKVEDGVIVFPLSARGKTARVEGVVEELRLTYEEALEEARHQAEEHGTEFDPTSVPEGPQTRYRIRGIGAVVAD